MSSAPKGSLNVAEEFFEGYNIINRHYPPNQYKPLKQIIHLPHVKHYLLGHSLELSLKAVLLKGGLSSDYLKSKVGHNLETCLKLSEQEGFNIFDDEEKKSIKLLNHHYFRKDFEYPKNGYINTPYLSKVEKIVEKSLKEANKIIH